MTLGQFEQLCEADQEYILTKKAVHVGSVVYGKKTFILFQVDAFYLEIQHEPSGGQFRSASFFEETELLAPYLDQIDISEIYACLDDN